MAPKKKVVKNAFYYFMMEVKMKEEAKGHMFRGGLSEVATFASSMWNEMGSDERMPYNRMAMDMKRQRGDDLTKKFTSLGVSYATLDAEEREQEEALQEMTATVKNLVRSLPKDGGLKTRRFFVAHVNYFYKNSKDVYIPAEFAMASFSLQEGVVDYFHCFIDPNFGDKSHLGFRFEANDWSQKTHSIPFGDSGWDRGVKSYYRLNGQVLQFIKNNNLEDDSIPPIFTMPDSLNNNTSISAVKSLFHELATSNDDVDEIPYRIYPLPQLFFELRNHCVDEAESTSYNQSLLKLPTVAMAENEIEKDLFTYAKNLGCSYHELKDLAVHCSQSIVFRWVFTICDNCCMHLGINLVLGRHCPHDADVDKFLDYETGNRRGDVAGAVSMPERGAAAAPMPGTSWSHNSPSSSPTSSESSSVWKNFNKGSGRRSEKELSKEQTSFMPTIINHGELREKYNNEAKQNPKTSLPGPVQPNDVRLPMKSSYSTAIKNRLPGTSGVVPKLTSNDFPKVGQASGSSRHQSAPGVSRVDAVNLPRPLGRGRGMSFTDKNGGNEHLPGSTPRRDNSSSNQAWPVSGRGSRYHQ